MLLDDDRGVLFGESLPARGGSKKKENRSNAELEIRHAGSEVVCQVFSEAGGINLAN